jgi:CHASE1-domain containing sensor protein/nitrogen-specific signal transduction histidine kinase/CheY-like chemotaxis protein
MQHRRALPIVILILGLVASLAAAWLLATTEEQRREARFEGAANGIVAAVESRMLGQLTLLRGAAGFFNASDQVTREDFQAYVARLRLETNYPGVLGIGYAVYAPDRTALRRIEQTGRDPAVPDYRAWPAGERPDYSAIVYLEPMNRMNRTALGFDMLSEATRRAAMEGARRSGSAQMSGRVQLVQEIDPVKQPGFLIYVPLYRGQRGEADEVLDPAELYGWVYSPLRAYDLFEAIFDDDGLGGTVVEVYDERQEEARLLYRSGEAPAGDGLAAVRPIEVAGREWLVRIAPGPGFERQSPLGAAALVGLGGTLITLLIAALMQLQIRGRERTESEVALRTAELTAANRRLLAEAKARESAEAQVRQMQKMEAIGQLTGGIAHDFNNMLAVVIGNLDIVERRLGDPERIGRAVRNARSGAEKAANLTARLLAFGRQQSLSPRVLDPDRLVAGMTELLRRTLGEKIRLETELGGSGGAVCADPTQLENAVLNLAINGRDAMPDGGVLTIATAEARLVEEDAAAGDEGAPGAYVVLSVRDTGTGMSPEVAEKAVEPFFTTKAVGRGTGLGLSQVYGFARQSGGFLRLRSRPGEGTSAEIWLPRHGAAPEAAQEEQAPGELPRARDGETVLVVEDEEQVRELSAGGLRELGYKVIEASNGADALPLLRRHPEVGLLFSDVVMPEMDGRRLAEEARTLRPDLRLLFTTGYAPDTLPGEGAANGAALLQKPFTLAQLALRVREELDRSD